MRLDRAWIASHIPHHGRMCLLDEVIRWDAERISCRSTSHCEVDHPLRAHGRLGIACGIEYAAQAMAVHGALMGGAAEHAAQPGTARDAAPAAGFLAGVRAITLQALRLADVFGALICNAARVAGDHKSALYEFELRSEAARLLSGRATVVLDADGRLLT